MKAKILIIDDEEQILRLLTFFLTKNGFEVINAISGEEAIRALDSAEKLDLVVTDLRMPKITGFDVLKHMRAAGKNIPTLILTGSFNRDVTAAKLKELGYQAEDVCTKPIDLSLFLERIKQKLKKTA